MNKRVTRFVAMNTMCEIVFLKMIIIQISIDPYIYLNINTIYYNYKYQHKVKQYIKYPYSELKK